MANTCPHGPLLAEALTHWRDLREKLREKGEEMGRTAFQKTEGRVQLGVVEEVVRDLERIQGKR